MTRTVTIDGREVTFRASASIPRLYRIKFHRDIMQDMVTIAKAVKNTKDGKTSIPLDCLTLFENVAYLMAKHADPSVPSTVDEWLEGFNSFSIYWVFPVISEMWQDNIRTMSVPAKK